MKEILDSNLVWAVYWLIVVIVISAIGSSHYSNYQEHKLKRDEFEFKKKQFESINQNSNHNEQD